MVWLTTVSIKDVNHVNRELPMANLDFREDLNVLSLAEDEDLGDIVDFKTLVKDKSGVWISKKQEDISYPDEGNEACLQIEDSFSGLNTETESSAI